MTEDALPTADQLGQITEQVWSAYLEDTGEVSPATEHAAELAAPAERAELAASVDIFGAWEGRLMVACSHEASRTVAAVLLATPDEEVTADDIDDALGELANVLGGNVKSLLPSPSRLSLPTVGNGGHEMWPGAAEVCRAMVLWRGIPFTVVLLRSSRVSSDLEQVPA